MPALPMKRAGGARKRRVMPVFGRSLEDVYAEGGGLPPVFWDTLRLLSLKALTTPGLFRPHAVGRSCGHSNPSSGSGPERTCSNDSVSSPTSSDGSGDLSTRECGGAAADEGDGQNSGRKMKHGPFETPNCLGCRKVLLCKRLYDSGQDALKVLPSTTKDLHAVAGILKLWVASLPEPVVPPRLYDAMHSTQTAHSDKDAQVAALHSLLRQCEHRVLQVLFPLMEFLHHYCLNQAHPGRERQELARIFAPVLLRPAGCSVMAPSDDKGLAVACVAHMIREYRTLFVARKRAIVPPTVPSSESAAPSASGSATPAATAAGASEAPEPASSAPAIAAADPSHALLADSNPQHSGRQLAPLKVLCAGTDCGVTAHSIDDLPDSGSDASSDTDAGPGADAALEAAVADLLFSSTCALFAEQPGKATSPRTFFTTSPDSSPESSPVRRPLAAAEAGVNSSSAGVADMDADQMIGKKAECCLSPTSVPGGWAAMSDGDSSSAGSDGGSGDEALTDAGRTCAAALDFGVAASPPQLDDDTVLLEQLLSGDLDDDMTAVGSFGSLGGDGDSLLQVPADHVAYSAPPQGGLPAVAMQLAGEKALLKRQLRQLDADFEASTGRAPGRADKEALRPLYVRYWHLKHALAAAAAAAMPASSAVAMEA